MKSDISTIETLKDIISESEAVCVYFGSDDCSVCKVVRPKITELLYVNYPNIKYVYIDIQEIPEVSSQFSIHTVPVIIVYFEGKEFIRKVRNISLQEFEGEIERPYNLMF